MPRASFSSGRKKLLLLLAFAAVLIGIAWWWQRPPPAPVLNDILLSDAIYILDAHPLDGDGIRAYGPTAIPWLIYTLEHGKHPFIKSGPLPFDRTPTWLRGWVPEKWGGLRKSSLTDERVAPGIALSKLGPDAAPAIPALVRILQSKDEHLFAIAIATLPAIGPASTPAIQGLLDHGSPVVRSRLLKSISKRLAAPNASEEEVTFLFEAFLKALRDPDRMVRKSATDSFDRVRMDDSRCDSAIPVLIERLDDPDPSIRYWAVSTLNAFGVKAASSVPRLIELLDDKNAGMQFIVAETLSSVDRTEKLSAARLSLMANNDPDPKCRTAAAKALKDFGLSEDSENKGEENTPLR